MLKNIDEHIESVGEKFGYDDEVKGILKRIIPIMANGKSDNIQKMLYDTLDRVKIFVLDETPTEETVEKCKAEIMGDINKHITTKKVDKGEYGKGVSPGAYVNEPVFDENMNIVDRRSFLYVSRLSNYSELTKIYGTNINLSHLIHELGHAWAAQEEEFVIQQDGSYEMHVGACSQRINVNKDTHEIFEGDMEGIYVEEALNTIEEERILCELLNIQSIKDLTQSGYVMSNYQGGMSDIVKSYVDKFGKEAFDDYRFNKNKYALKDMENKLQETEAWQHLQTPEYMQRKKEKIDKYRDLEVTDEAKAIIEQTFADYDELFFSDNTKFTPLQKLNNVCSQLYTFNSRAKYNFGIVGNEHNMEIYKDVIIAIMAEGYVLKNQAKDIEQQDKKKDFLSELQSNVIPSNQQKAPMVGNETQSKEELNKAEI